VSARHDELGLGLLTLNLALKEEVRTLLLTIGVNLLISGGADSLPLLSSYMVDGDGALVVSLRVDERLVYGGFFRLQDACLPSASSKL